MENELITTLRSTIERESNKFEKDKTLESFEKALYEFNELVKAGKAKKRGYNLMSIDSRNTLQKSMVVNFEM